MTTLFATDLDRTLIYSTRAAALAAEGQRPVPADLVPVERYRDRDLTFMSRRQLDLLDRIGGWGAVVVPVTTRTLAQYRRVRMPAAGPWSAWAVAANGGLLLHHGEVDDDWYAAVRARLAGSSRDLTFVAGWLAIAAAPWIDHLRVADDLFLYTLVDQQALPAGAADDLAAQLDEWGWQLSVQGRKLYAVPRGLDKGAAVREVARRSGATQVWAAGDSLLDRGLLAAADLSLRPAHGELHETDYPADVVTASAGVAAGEELLRTVLIRLGADANRKAGGRVPPVQRAPVGRS